MATRTKTTTVERDEGDEDEEIEGTPAPLFDLGQNAKSKSIDRISVYRTDPDEGHLGYLPPDADERMIKMRYGGGEFRLQAKNSSGQIVKTLSTYKISGDPIFQSEIAEARWNRLNKLRGPTTERGEAPSSMREILLTIEERERQRREEEKARREEEREERDRREEKARREQREHEERLARDAAEREERRRKDEAEREERRRKEAREDEERRQRQHREDLERMEKQNAAALLQTQQFFQQLTAMTKRDAGAASAGDPVKLLVTGMELATKLAGGRGGEGDPPDALTALLSRLPETLGELRTTAKEAYQEVKGSRKKAAATPAANDGPEVIVNGPTAARLKQAIDILQRAGKDPEQFIDAMASHVIQRAEVVGAGGRAGARAAPPPAKPKKRTAEKKPPRKGRKSS